MGKRGKPERPDPDPGERAIGISMFRSARGVTYGNTFTGNGTGIEDVEGVGNSHLFNDFQLGRPAPGRRGKPAVSKPPARPDTKETTVPERKLFFCHASEDKDGVEAVAAQLRTKLGVHAWIDKYEIVGGQSLIQQVTEGIDSAHRFCVFLSPRSIEKPWVGAELRAALADDISGVRPDFVVPVLLERVDQVPRFLQDKKYIDVGGQPLDVWMREFEAMLAGGFSDQPAEVDNLVIQGLNPTQSTVRLHLTARTWPERIALTVMTPEPVVGANFWYERGGSGGLTDVAQGSPSSGHGLCLSIGQPLLTRGDLFVVEIDFGTAPVRWQDCRVQKGVTWA